MAKQMADLENKLEQEQARKIQGLGAMKLLLMTIARQFTANSSIGPTTEEGGNSKGSNPNKIKSFPLIKANLPKFS